MAKEPKGNGKRGKQAKAIPVTVTCPHCAKTAEVSIIRVVDQAGVPAESHFEQIAAAAGSDGLFDGEKGED